MNTAKIVIREVQGDSGFQVRQLFAERIREPRKAPKLHSHGQVLPLYKAGRNMLRIRIASSYPGYRPRDAWWGVPPVAIELPVVSEHLSELREVGIGSKASGHAVRVVNKTIGRDLSPALDAIVKIGQELGHVALEPMPYVKRRNQFGFRVNRHKHPLAAEVGRIPAADVALFLADERPDFIKLQIPGPHVANLRVHESGATFASDQQKPHDGVAVESGKPLGAADRAALQEALQRPCRILSAGTHRSKGRSGLRFGESCATGVAAPALDSPLAVGSESLADLVLAFKTGHVVSPLAFCGETSQNRFSGSMAWVTPRFGLVPASAETEAGTLSVKGYLARWVNGYYHRWTVGSEGDLNRDLHCIPPFSCRSVLIALSGSYLQLKSLPQLVCLLKHCVTIVSSFPERPFQRRFPLISRFAFIVLCGLYFVGFYQSSQNPMNGGHRIDGRQFFVVEQLKSEADGFRSEGKAVVSEDFSDGFGQAEFPDLSGVITLSHGSKSTLLDGFIGFALTKRIQTFDGLLQSHNFSIQLKPLLDEQPHFILR
jgi:hypothetical protein